jgi:hypothetical protein
MNRLYTLIVLLIVVYTNFEASAQDQIDVDQLIERYQNLPTNGDPVSYYFNQEEQKILHELLKNDGSNTNSRSFGGSLLYGVNNVTLELGSFTLPSEQFNVIGPSANSTDAEVAGDMDPNDPNTAYVISLDADEFYRLDIPTGVYTFLGIVAAPANQNWSGLEFDPQTGTLYASSSGFVQLSNVSTISIIDKNTLVRTSVGNTGTTGLIAIAITDSGAMYGYDNITDSFYSINKTTGAASLIGPIGFDATFGQDMEWDSDSGTMYMTAFNNDVFDAELRTVNLNTGATTLIGGIIPGEATQIIWSSVANPLLGVNDRVDREFSVFPNPTSGILNINAKFPIRSIRIYNVLGELVATKSGLVNDQIDVSSLQSGAYFLQLQVEGEMYTLKFIKD